MNGIDATIEGIPSSFHGARKGSFVDNILAFCRVLKSLRVNITMGRVLDVFRSLEHINVSEKEDLYYTLRSNLISDHYQFPLFDKVFQVFWLFLKELKNGDDADQSENCHSVTSERVGVRVHSSSKRA